MKKKVRTLLMESHPTPSDPIKPAFARHPFFIYVGLSLDPVGAIKGRGRVLMGKNFIKEIPLKIKGHKKS